MPLESDKVKAIFLAAKEKASAAERDAYLEEACAGDAALRQRVGALLQADKQPDRLLDRPAAEHLSREPAKTAGPDVLGGPLADLVGERRGEKLLLRGPER